MAIADKVAEGVITIFENATDQADQETKAFLDKEFKESPSLMYRIAAFLKQPTLRAVIEGNIQRGEPCGAQPAKKVLSTKLGHLGRRLAQLVQFGGPWASALSQPTLYNIYYYYILILN